jgi:hypothetical protein
VNWAGITVALGLLVVGATVGPWGMLAFVVLATWLWRRG